MFEVKKVGKNTLEEAQTSTKLKSFLIHKTNVSLVFTKKVSSQICYLLVYRPREKRT